MSEKIVMIDSPEAAALKTVEGWVSRDGRFFGKGESAKRAARWSGATHQYCSDCSAVIRKGGWLICGQCRERRAVEKHKQAPRAAWDGNALLYSDLLGRFAYSPEEAIELAEPDHAEPPSLEHLRLYICEPQYAPELDVDYFADVLPEDSEGDLPDWASAAIEKFNDACKGRQPLSWMPGKYAMDADAYESA